MQEKLENIFPYHFADSILTKTHFEIPEEGFTSLGFIIRAYL